MQRIIFTGDSPKIWLQGQERLRIGTRLDCATAKRHPTACQAPLDAVVGVISKIGDGEQPFGGGEGVVEKDPKFAPLSQPHSYQVRRGQSQGDHVLEGGVLTEAKDKPR